MSLLLNLRALEHPWREFDGVLAAALYKSSIIRSKLHEGLIQPFFKEGNDYTLIPEYTAHLEAALTLLPDEGYTLQIRKVPYRNSYQCELQVEHSDKGLLTSEYNVLPQMAVLDAIVQQGGFGL